jgi:Fic family protein
MKKKSQVFSKIQNLQERYLALSVGKESLLEIISASEISEQVYNSNAIENSTLSLDETEKILRQIDLDRFINERELFEAKNLARVVEYTSKKAKDEELNMEKILFLHKMLLSNIRDEIAGRFRQKGEWVRVGNYIAPDPEKVEEMLQEMFLVYKTSAQENIITRIARLHLMFENIHPFCDGNGRIGRVIINYLLIREGYVPINIKFIDRSLYYQAFRQFDEKKETWIMEEIVGKALSNSFHKRIAYLKGKEIILLSDYAKREKISHSNLLNKANRQTIEAFSERGKWKIGV